MKIVYSLPHPSHRLGTPGAGHTVRANAILAALQQLGAEIVVDQAAAERSQTAAKTYRQLVKRLIPSPIAMRLRDRARVAFGRRYGERLTEVVRKHQPDVILQTHIAFSLSGKIASQATGIPLVLDDVAPSWEEKQQYGVGNQRLAESTHHEVTSQAALCVAVSGPMRRFLEEDGISSDKLIQVPNGISAAIFHPDIDGREIRRRYQITDSTVVVVFVGSFQPYHRVDLLIEAFSRLRTDRDVRLLLVGAGREQAAAQALVDRLGVSERVVFTSAVDYQEVPRHIAAGDVAVMPATNTYGNPMKVYEYMALGKAVIAPNQDTITEIGTHQSELLTFRPESIDALAAALNRVIEQDDFRTALGEAAAKAIASDHTWLNRGQTLLSAIEARIG